MYLEGSQKTMSDYVIKSGGSGSYNIVRLVNGAPVASELTEAERAAYATPPSNKYRLKITGFHEPWEQARNAKFISADSPATHETKTRLEFEIVEGKGKGKRFSSMVTWAINDRSNLGKVWKAVFGSIGSESDLTDLLDKELVIYVDKTDGIDKDGNAVSYANPSWATAKAVGDTEDDGDEWPS